MATTTKTIQADITTELARLRLARAVGDVPQIRVVQRRLDWLLDKLPRQETTP